MSARIRLRRRAALTGAVLLSTASGIVVTPGQAMADGPPYSATANAYGVLVTAANPGMPFGLTLEGSGPTTSATLASLGTSTAFASFPYPGSTIANFPAVFGALINFPVPSYPLLAATSNGAAPQSVDYPGITLRAANAPDEIDAYGNVGSGGLGFVSQVRIQQEGDGNVVSTAGTSANALQLGPLLSLTGLTSNSTVTADGSSGELVRSSSLTIGRINVAGLALPIPKSTAEQFPTPNPIPGLPQAPPLNLPPLPIPVVGGTTIQNPDVGFQDGHFTLTLPVAGELTKFALPADLVAKAFDSVGLGMRFQAAEETDSGVSSPAVTFTYTLPGFPENPSGFSQPTPVSFTVGATDASVTLNALAPDASPLPAATMDAGVPAGIAAGDPGVDLATGNPLLPSIAVPEQAATAVAGTVPVAALSFRSGLGSVSLSYLAVVIAGAVLLAAAFVAQTRGGRRPWRS